MRAALVRVPRLESDEPHCVIQDLRTSSTKIGRPRELGVD
jgi:hypothetical protein